MVKFSCLFGQVVFRDIIKLLKFYNYKSHIGLTTLNLKRYFGGVKSINDRKFLIKVKVFCYVLKKITFLLEKLPT